MPDPHSSKAHRPRRGNEHPINFDQLEREAFWLFVSEEPSGCWEWQGRANDTGYGVFRVRGINYRAHRVSWTLTRGALANGLTLDHGCRNRMCVNPAHMEAVTNGENILRGESPTAANARKTHCKYGHEFTPDNILWTHPEARRRECKQCRKDKRARLKQWRSGPHADSPRAPDLGDSSFIALEPQP